MSLPSNIEPSRFMTLNPTADVVTYPADGAGAKTTTSTSSDVYNMPTGSVALEGMIIFPTAGPLPAVARIVTLYQHDGTTQIGGNFNVPAGTATQIPYFAPFGPPGIGLKVPFAATGGCNFAIKVAGTSDIPGLLVYRKLRRK